MSGEYEVEYADNRPHIPVGVNGVAKSIVTEPLQNEVTTDNNMENSSVVKKTTNLHCPRCGSYDITPVSEVSTKGKDFNAGDACCGYMLCGPLGLLCGATGKGKQITTTTYWVCKCCGNKFKV